MAILKPFKGIRPPVGIVSKLASRPYDVLNSEEARVEAKGNEYSLLHIIKPEIDLEPGIDVHSKVVYETARDNFNKFQNNGWLIQDEKDHLYIYAQTMHGKTQYGLVGCAAVEDYMNGIIKKHELTRPDKEEDRMKHVRINNANIEPVFFTYPRVEKIDLMVANWVEKNDPVYDFVADDGVGHHFWVINDDHTIHQLTTIFGEVPATYVADGHHRTAAAALVGNEKKQRNPYHTGDEEYNYFLAVHFPDNQLSIIDYNRVVKDLNGMTPAIFLEKLTKGFVIKNKGEKIYKPLKLHEFSMYLEGNWYSMEARPGTYDNKSPVGKLDVTILTTQVLDPLLGITDLRRSTRIDFIGGIRGLEELKNRVVTGEYCPRKIAPALLIFPSKAKGSAVIISRCSGASWFASVTASSRFLTMKMAP